MCVTGQATANLHQLLATLFDPSHPNRRVILGDALNFASDTYAIQSHLRLRGFVPATHLRPVSSADGRTLRTADIIAAFAPDVQLAVLPAVRAEDGFVAVVPGSQDGPDFQDDLAKRRLRRTS